jgi:hypothetical protein
MPNVEENKTVDIDTSGPGAEVELQDEKDELVVDTEASNEEKTEQPSEDKTFENERETKLDEATTEDKKEDDNELEQYSKDVKKRISKLTHKWREAERQREEALTYAEKMILAKTKAEEKLSKLEPGYLKSTEDSITSGVQAAQAKLAAAREANDLAAEAEALTSISELGYKKAKLEETKVAQEEYNKKQESRPASDINLNRQPVATGTPDPKAETWATKNSWFGQDSAMTYTAFDLHKKLTEEEGFDPSSDEYYVEIDKRIRLEFPHKFGTTEPTETTKPVQQVASAKRTTKSSRRTVTLTPSQVAIAKKLGVPLEEYAKQLNITKEV